MGSQRFSILRRSALLIGVTFAGVLGTAADVRAQALKDVQTSDTPLVLKAQGSFFVGGEKVEQTQGELGNLGPGGGRLRTRFGCGEEWLRRAVAGGCDYADGLTAHFEALK